MKKLGLIGGVGPETTLKYYKEIEYGVMEKLGRSVLPRITIESLSCFRMIPLGAAQDYKGMTDYIMSAVRGLEKAGCDFIALACITGHMVYKRVQPQCHVPMLSIVDTCLEAVIARGCRKALLLGTEGTMKDDFFKQPFRSAGLEIVVPSPKEQQYVGWYIENELEHGIIREDVRKEFYRIVDYMVKKDGVDALILGCTELPLIVRQEDLSIPVFDPTEYHIRKTIDMICS